MRDLPTGDVYGEFLLDGEGAAALRAALSPLAAPQPAADGQRDDRTIEQRNADALVELATRALNLGALPTEGGERPHVTVTITYDVLLQQISSAWLDGVGPISPETARRYACDTGVIPWLEGGVTALHNLVLLCPQHHRLIHHSEWTIEVVGNYPIFHPPPWLGDQPLRNPLHGPRE